MAIKVNFANGTYTEDDFNDEFASIVGSTEKIIIGNSDSLKVTQSDPLGLKVTIKSGKCFINGKFCVNDANVDVTIESNLSGTTRKDIIVLDITDTQNPVFRAIKGDFSAPGASSTQLLLAEINVKNNSLSIMNSDIVDTRILGSFLNKKDIIEGSQTSGKQWSFNFFGIVTIKCGLVDGINSNWKRINYAKPFKSACFNIQMTEINYADGANQIILDSRYHTNAYYFDARCETTKERSFYWLALGK